MHCWASIHLISYTLADFVGVELCEYFHMAIHKPVYNGTLLFQPPECNTECKMNARGVPRI